MLISFVDVETLLSYKSNELQGAALLTGFSEIMLQFTLFRDFFITVILACSGQNLKFALSYRLAACTVDFMGVMLIASYSVGLIQNKQFGTTGQY